MLVPRVAFAGVPFMGAAQLGQRGRLPGARTHRTRSDPRRAETWLRLSCTSNRAVLITFWIVGVFASGKSA